ncbi:unnamed protein product [Protopolystoma xenopodis]|uniref:Uncharacterized protein n=1 Tax=Protopolystoma xenopodis TaxID=117903 RepID=A0A448XCT7_9PLAT|nr:unnamed protein product [Protopolystoma xenopodis]
MLYQETHRNSHFLHVTTKSSLFSFGIDGLATQQPGTWCFVRAHDHANVALVSACWASFRPPGARPDRPQTHTFIGPTVSPINVSGLAGPLKDMLKGGKTPTPEERNPPRLVTDAYKMGLKPAPTCAAVPLAL